MLGIEEKAVIVVFRKHTLLPLDDSLYALQATIPHLTRSSLHCCLQRHGISRLPEVTGGKEPKCKFKTYPIGCFHIDVAEGRPPRANYACSWRSTGPASSPLSSCTSKQAR